MEQLCVHCPRRVKSFIKDRFSFRVECYFKMYIKVRPMTGGDPATITVSKLTSIKELRVWIINTVLIGYLSCIHT